jgi:hypothetical protein
MAKKTAVNKTQAVRDYLKSHPKAMSGEIATALNDQGIKIKPGHVANIKTKLNNAGAKKKVAKQTTPAEVVPAVAEKKNGGTITLEQVRKVAQTVKAMGGFQRMTEVLEVIRELGGVKKFKDLAEAMTVVETDAVPY